MKLNKVMASLITVMGAQVLTGYAQADRIIQRPAGTFYIVSDQEASQAFDRNNFGFFMLSPSTNLPVYDAAPVRQKHTKKSVHKPTSHKTTTKPAPCVPVECPVTPAKPVTTIEPAESIYLRLENKK
ncbi:hypothetical protein YB29_003830 [Salmonella enterica subsp. enterica]|nr:hypothetical protein [Salmonella enterica subsp. enterica]EDV1188894.1 hypothetical protein [Salmonella enterica subsp. enterica]